LGFAGKGLTNEGLDLGRALILFSYIDGTLYSFIFVAALITLV
jgi:hypothetical protein